MIGFVWMDLFWNPFPSYRVDRVENDFFHFWGCGWVDSFVVDYYWWFWTKKWSLAPKPFSEFAKIIIMAKIEKTPKYAYFKPKKFFENFLFTWKVIYFLTKMRESVREMIEVTFPTNLQEKIIFSTKWHLKNGKNRPNWGKLTIFPHF